MKSSMKPEFRMGYAEAPPQSGKMFVLGTPQGYGRLDRGGETLDDSGVIVADATEALHFEGLVIVEDPHRQRLLHAMRE